MVALQRPSRLPVSTYRVQFRPGFGFREVLDIVPYLHALGITDLYASPLLAARAGSQHGYDVTDPTRLNPQLGTRDEFEALADALASRGMGLLLDIVPNHMAADASNPWWWDVLEHGRASEHARWFDIDWSANDGRIVLPVLGGQLAEVLDNDELKIVLAATGPELRYHGRRFPLGAITCAALLAPVADLVARALGADAGESFRRVLEGARRIPGAESEAAHRGASCAVRDGLVAWIAQHPGGASILNATRPTRGQIESLLSRQHYSLEFWKDGLRRINYRRFFDVSDLVSLRMEEPGVFESTHALILDLIRDGAVSGLRIDHIDGLHDPAAYLERLHAAAAEAARGAGPARPLYLVAEKILGRGERLPGRWPVAGTTGYEFANAATRLLVDPAGFGVLAAHAAGAGTLEEEGFWAKREALEGLFPAELASLTGRLVALAAAGGVPASRDALREALVCITASMDVYRTYAHAESIEEADRRRIEAACARAAARCDGSGIGFVRDVLLLRIKTLTKEGLADRLLAFVMRWQQLTGPVMAKGVEDTLLYRHIVLTCLNEVGGEPEMREGADPAAEFHALNAATAAERPWTMTALSTHDTKRSEDARARIAVLSEMAEEWVAAVERWRGWNGVLKKDGAPSGRDELLVYQSLLAVWPLRAVEAGSVAERVRAYMVKAVREAKVESSWAEPDGAHEGALGAFVDGLLDARRSGAFLREFLEIQRRVAFHGMLNGLAQTVLRLVSPGVADTYQGTEMWDLSLVDPDNRRAVDFSSRREALERFAAGQGPAFVGELREAWEDGRIKLWVTTALLHLRREMAPVFLDGAYYALAVRGERARHVVALAREGAGRWVVAVVPRLTVGLGGGWPIGEAWGETEVELPPGAPGEWREVVGGAAVSARGGTVRVGEVLRELPVGVLMA